MANEDNDMAELISTVAAAPADTALISSAQVEAMLDIAARGLFYFRKSHPDFPAPVVQRGRGTPDWYDPAEIARWHAAQRRAKRSATLQAVRAAARSGTDANALALSFITRPRVRAYE